MNKSPADLGVALIGAGRMGLTHLRNLLGIPGVRVVAVADPDLAAAERGRVLARAERATTDIAGAIEAAGVDAVIIVTPTDTHAGLIELAVRAGRAVFCEKPIALDFGESCRVADLARAAGVPVQLGFMRRFDPGYAEAGRRIAAGELGRLETFRALSRDTYPPPLEFLRASGGLFLDMAVHDFDLARFLVGEVAEVVCAQGAVLIDERFAQADDIDTAVTTLRFANGALGVVETSRRSVWGYDIRTEIAGAAGKLVVEAGARTPLAHATDFGVRRDHHENFPDRFEAAYRRELEAFFQALAEGRPPTPGPEDAVETQRLALAAKRSWREGRPVRVAEITA